MDIKTTYLKAIGDGLLMAMDKYSNAVVFGEGVDNITGVYGIVLPAYKKFGPGRVIDTPLSENALTGIATGASLNGIRPVLFHQRNDFLMLTMDQLVNHAAKIRYFSGGKHKVPMTIVSFIARKVGEGCQHSQSFQSLIAHIPGLKVFMPANPHDAQHALQYAIEDDNPTVVLYHRDLFDMVTENELDNDKPDFNPSHINILREGSEVTLVGVSATVKNCLEAASKFEDGVVQVIDLCSIRPMPKNGIVNCVSKTGRLIVVDTGWNYFGVSSEVIATVAENIDQLKAKPVRMGMVEIPAPASRLVEKIYHPNTESIVEVIRKMLC